MRVSYWDDATKAAKAQWSKVEARCPEISRVSLLIEGLACATAFMPFSTLPRLYEGALSGLRRRTGYCFSARENGSEIRRGPTGLEGEAT